MKDTTLSASLRLPKEALLFDLDALYACLQESMPHSSTWSRVLGHGVEPHEVEERVGQFFAQALRRAPGKRGSIQLAIDGKTMRGTIPSSSNGRRA